MYKVTKGTNDGKEEERVILTAVETEALDALGKTLEQEQAEHGDPKWSETIKNVWTNGVRYVVLEDYTGQ